MLVIKTIVLLNQDIAILKNQSAQLAKTTFSFLTNSSTPGPKERRKCCYFGIQNTRASHLFLAAAISFIWIELQC